MGVVEHATSGVAAKLTLACEPLNVRDVGLKLKPWRTGVTVYVPGVNPVWLQVPAPSVCTGPGTAPPPCRVNVSVAPTSPLDTVETLPETLKPTPAVSERL